MGPVVPNVRNGPRQPLPEIERTPLITRGDSVRTNRKNSVAVAWASGSFAGRLYGSPRHAVNLAAVRQNSGSLVLHGAPTKCQASGAPTDNR